MMIKIEASKRLISELSLQEKLLHYKRMLERVKARLRKIDPSRTPYAYNRYKAREARITERLGKLKQQHRY